MHQAGSETNIGGVQLVKNVYAIWDIRALKGPSKQQEAVQGFLQGISAE